MNPVRIIVDSTADLTPEVRSRLTVVPLTIHFGEEQYIDGITITHKAFYEKLIECDTLPTTSQATPFHFTEHFEKAVAAGEDVVAITLSSKLSGTFQSAMIAAEDFPGRVHVVDSRSVALGSGILAEYALTLADQGLSAAAIAEALTREREKVHLVALLDTLEFLKRGGRISSAVAFAGGMLSIKPIICLDGGKISILTKARGAKQGGTMLTQQAQALGAMDPERPFLLGYTGVSDEQMQAYLQEHAAALFGGKSVPTSVVGSVVGTHAGPGAIALAFFEKAAE